MKLYHFSHNRQVNSRFILLLLVLAVGIPWAPTQAAVTATNCVTQSDIPPDECYALLALYDSTDGPNWTNNTGWNVTNSPCSWFGVGCSGGKVQSVALPDNRLNGTIPDIPAAGPATFDGLEYLNLNSNQLNGSIPNLSMLTSLQTLNLSDNQLDGSIPSLSALTNLVELRLDYNQLSGNIPALSTLTNIQIVWLENNQLNGSIPNLSTLTSLQVLILSTNQLDGSIPDLSTLNNLVALSLDGNQLSGNIPALSALTNIQILWLQHNQLSGYIPELSTLTNLRSLDLMDNQLDGSIPNLSALSMVRRISLSGNQLSGGIPDLSDLTNLQYLDVSNNRLSGAIPDLSALSFLSYLYLENNQLDSQVPTSVCQATAALDIGYNKLEVDTADSCVDTADPDWKETQTVPPTSVAATPLSAAEVQLTWNPIAYVQDGGRYNVWGKAQNEADYTLMASTTNKTSAEVVVSGLQPGTTYEFVVRTFTSAHDEQQSNLISADSDVVTAVTESTLLFLPLITNAAP